VKNGHNPLKGWALLLIGALAAAAPVSAQVSLATVVDLAQHNSSTVKLAEADVQKAQAVLQQSKDVYLPSFNFGSGLPAFPSVGFTGGVPSTLNGTVQSLVFSLPQKYYMDAARSGLKTASLNLKNAREQVALETSTTYIELDTIERELEASHQQEAFANRLVSIEQERSEAGVDPLSELLQAQLTAAQLKLKRLHLETRAATLSKQLATLTGLPTGSITPDHASIPEIPAVKADEAPRTTIGVESAQMLAHSKQQQARGDSQHMWLPQISFRRGVPSQHHDAERRQSLLQQQDPYTSPANNFSSGFQIQVPLFDWAHRDKGKESAAEALRATVEAEQAQRQNELQIAELTGNLRELDTLAEIASLKQQIAKEQLQSVLAQLELGNGASAQSGAQQQLSPKAEQLARIDERQLQQDALEAGFDLAKARLSLLGALGHMEDWLHELHAK
jgi:outer membrane protein TolC